MTKSADIPDIFQPVVPEDYAVLYDAAQYVRAERATVEIADLNLVVCGFCGGTSDLKRWQNHRGDIEHRDGCLAVPLAQVAAKLAKPINRPE